MIVRREPVEIYGQIYSVKCNLIIGMAKPEIKNLLLAERKKAPCAITATFIRDEASGADSGTGTRKDAPYEVQAGQALPIVAVRAKNAEGKEVVNWCPAGRTAAEPPDSVWLSRSRCLPVAGSNPMARLMRTCTWSSRCFTRPTMRGSTVTIRRRTHLAAPPSVGLRRSRSSSTTADRRGCELRGWHLGCRRGLLTRACPFSWPILSCRVRR